MAIRYFKKLSPSTAVVIDTLGNPIRIEFSTLDQLAGFYATDQDQISQCFEKFMREQRYGITEISADEFHRDYVQKKTPQNQPSPKWREEMSGSSVRPTGYDPVTKMGSVRVAAVVGVNGTDIKRNQPVTIAEPAKVVEEEKIERAPDGELVEKKKFEPNLGKRKSPK
jgi:hypothetical protein